MKDNSENTDFFKQLKLRRGLIPVSIDNDNLNWLDIEKYHFFEGFFHNSVNTFTALKNGTTFNYSTPYDILQNPDIVTNYVQPAGFIFHAGRCGSTLLSRIISLDPQNLLLSEAEPLNAIWSILTINGQQPLQTADNEMMYRNLVLAMARKRIAVHQKLFIKFTSFNIRFFDFIHSIFPNVPAIFLTRNISEIIKSCHSNPPGWIKINDKRTMKILTGYTTCDDLHKIIEGFLKEAKKQKEGILKHIDYSDLTPENLPTILNFFNIEPDEKTLRLMKQQFLYHSKHDVDRMLFHK